MSNKAQAVWAWTWGKTKAAADATYTGTRNVVAMTSERAGYAAKAVAGKSKDAAGVAVGTAAVQASVVPTLNAVGFSAIGPTAGSSAAAFMASYGAAVPAGSACAMAQSIAMTGVVGLSGPLAVTLTAYGAYKGVQYLRAGSKVKDGSAPPPSDGAAPTLPESDHPSSKI